MEKKGLAILAALLVLVAIIPRPVAAAVDFNLGAKAGVSISKGKWSGEDWEGLQKALIRPTFGVFAVINLSAIFAVQPEINYLTVGTWWGETFVPGEYKEYLAQNYLHIPVLLKARLAKNGKVFPIVFAGPAIGFLLSARHKGFENGSVVNDFSIKDDFKSTDFGIDFGVQTEILVSHFKLLLDLRYYLGLVNVHTVEPITVKNNALIITAGALF